MATTAAIGREWARGSAALAAMALPPATVLAALGLGAAGLAAGDAALAATGAVAGAVGAGVAGWRASALQGRMRHDRERYLESRRTLQLLIEQLRRRGDPAAAVGPTAGAGTTAEPEASAEAAGPPAQRPADALPVSMEMPVLSTLDELVAQGHLAAVVELREVRRQVPGGPLPVGESERQAYAAIAAQA